MLAPSVRRAPPGRAIQWCAVYFGELAGRGGLLTSLVPYVGGTAACPGDVAGNGKVTGNGKVADGPLPPQVAVPGRQNPLSAQRGDIFPPVKNPQFPKKSFGKIEKVIFMMDFFEKSSGKF